MPTRPVPIQTLHLFPTLDRLLIELLQSLTEEEWQRPTIARLWTVKDVAAHLLDGSLRNLSMSRDGFFGVKPENAHSYADLVVYINDLNMSWTSVARRLSPQVLTELLEIYGQQYNAYLATLDPFADAIFSVAWAGQTVSPNWFHVAREYTEKFLHQQQIRDAVGKPGLLTKELYPPYLDTLMQGLPHAYRNVDADAGTRVSVVVATEAGGQWFIVKQATGWALTTDDGTPPDATAELTPDDAWKLFSKGIKPDEALDRVRITGDRALGQTALHLVAVMA